MKGFKIKVTPETRKIIQRLHPEQKKIIKHSLQELQRNPYRGDELQGELSGFKSYKPKRYRIIYKVDDQKRLILVHYIGHIRDVYEQFKTLLTKLSSKNEF